MRGNFRIWLSAPEVFPEDAEAAAKAVQSGWLAPAGPQLDAFEDHLATVCQVPYVLATQTGTAALHLALHLAGVAPGKQVLLPALTYIATANPVRYLGGEPVLVDTLADDIHSDWSGALHWLEQEGIRPQAILPVHLMGQGQALGELKSWAEQNKIPLIEDAAEALGVTIEGRPVGSLARFGVLSFNGNKLITASGGGALLCQRAEDYHSAKQLAAQARDKTQQLAYHHSAVGYNYRMSNLNAALALAQLKRLPERIARRKWRAEQYRQALPQAELPIRWLPAQKGVEPNYWLNVLFFDSAISPLQIDELQKALHSLGIETRRVWKPLHLQPPYRACKLITRSAGAPYADTHYQQGLCLPSGGGVTEQVIAEIAATVRTFIQQVAN